MRVLPIVLAALLGLAASSLSCRKGDGTTPTPGVPGKPSAGK
jgi:hypothetical protein